MKTKKQSDKPINFDDFASNYENHITESFGSIDNNVSYYHSAKAKILKKELNYYPKKILDFGCGVGLMLRYLKENFKQSEFYAYDDSSKSLNYIKSKYKDVTCINNLNLDIKFDLIFVSNVIHHVKSEERNDLFKKIYECLNEDGKLFVIEHNPYNPLTLKLVANCEFDADAELIKKKDLINLCKKNNFKAEKSGYIHFFPSKLKFLFNVEFYLKWLFLGAQYFCVFKK
jgi:ubiquinone/menaquinone biosynthesis C-methylase UbiE